MTALSGTFCIDCFKALEQNATCSACGASQIDSSRDRRALRLGTVVAGKYRVGRVLGSGGFGITYLAMDVTLSRRVALKEFVPNGLASRSADGVSISCHSYEDEAPFERGLNRFFLEGQIMAKFDHPNVVRVFDVLPANGTAYLAMEYLDGMTLKALLAQKGMFAEHEALDVMTFVFDALKVVHQQSVIHRDIKPDNIYVTNHRRVLLLDFGGAKQLTGSGDRSMDAMFAHGYAAPEQYSGHSENVGAWTDVYASAATLFKLMTGKTPRSALDRFNNDAALDWGAVPVSEKIRGAVAQAMSFKHQDRFPTVSDFQLALSEGVRTPRPTPLIEPQKKQGLATKVLLTAGIVSVVAAAAWFKFDADQAELMQHKIRNAIALEGLRERISQFHAKYARFPQTLADLGGGFIPDAEVNDLKIEAGEINIMLALKGLEGKRLQLRPTEVVNNRVQFECWVLDVPEKYVPKDMCKIH